MRPGRVPTWQPYTRLADEKGMHLAVTASGGRYWRLKYRHAGKEKRLALGVHPVVSLAQARKDRDKARDTLAAGDNRRRPSETSRQRGGWSTGTRLNRWPGGGGRIGRGREVRVMRNM